MTRYVGKNSTEGKVAAVRAGAREVMFKPAAHRWLQPAIDGAPVFQNSWAQVDPTPPYSVEPFAYRLNADGKFEVKGHLSAASATSGSVVTTVPAAILVPVSVEPSYRLSEARSTTVPVTVDGGTTYVPGTIVLDNATGQLKVFWSTPTLGGLGPPHLVLNGGAASPTTGTWWPIPMDTLIYDPDRVVKGDIFDWATTDTGDTGNDRFEITTMIPGWYAVELVTYWDQVTTPGGVDHGYAVTRLSFTNTSLVWGEDGDLRAAADWLDNNYAPSGFEMVDAAIVKMPTTIFHLRESGGNIVWKPTAKQVTGATRGLTGFMKLWWLGQPNDPFADWTVEFA